MIWTCPRCEHEEKAADFLEHLCSWDAGTDTVSHRCGGCGQTEPVRLKSGAVVFGYIYAAGTAHFSEEEEVGLPDLEIERTDEGLSVRFQEGKQAIDRLLLPGG